MAAVIGGHRLSRRGFVAASSGAAAAVVLSGPLAPAAVAGVSPWLRRSSYDSLIGSAFTVGGTVALRLESLADLERSRSEPELRGRDDAFTLVLAGAPGLPAATHAIAHAELGAAELFLAPFDHAGATQLYEVVVDRTVRLAAAQESAPEPLAGGAAGASATLAAPAPAASESPARAPARRRRRRRRRVLRASAARRGDVLAADVRVARGLGLSAVQVSLVRDGAVVARGFRRLGRRVGVRVTLRARRRVVAGEYWLQVTTTDRHGRRATSEHRVALR